MGKRREEHPAVGGDKLNFNLISIRGEVRDVKPERILFCHFEAADIINVIFRNTGCV